MEAHLSATKQADPDTAAWLLVSHGVVQDCNDKCAAIFGYTSAELIGVPLVVLFSRNAWTNGAETLGKHRDGSALWLRVAHEPLVDVSPSVRTKMVIEDITESKLHEYAAA